MTTDKGLMVWLPLTDANHCENQGLVGKLTCTTTLTLVDGGKLGKCLSTGAYQMSAEQTTKVFNNNHLTIAFWVYIDAATGASSYSVFIGNERMNANDNRKFMIMQYPTVNDLHYSWMNDAAYNAFIASVIKDVLPSYKWTHVAITYENPTAIIYINGVEVRRNTGVSNSSTFAYTTPIIENNTGRRINDFRIYSYALSPQEIKELSRGKIGHWLGDGNGTFLKNLLTSNTNGAGTPANYQREFCNSISSYTPSVSGIHLVTPNSGNVNNGFRYFVNAFSKAQVSLGKTYTISCSVKGTSDTNKPFLCIGYNIKQTSAFWYQNNVQTIKIFTPTNIYQRISCTITLPTTGGSVEMFYFGVSGNRQSDLWIKDWKLEEGSINSCYTISSTPTFLSDISGFGRHGQIVGNVTLDSSTPRYDKSIKFSTNTCERYIAAPAMNFLTNTLTFSCWVSQFNRTCVNNKVDHTLQFIMSQGRDNTAGFSLICRNGVPGVMFGNGTTFKSIFNSSVMPLNTWHHIAATYDGTNVKFYYDGNYIAQSTISNIEYLLLKDPTTGVLGYPNPALVLGKMSFGYTSTGTYFPFAGNISDARVYATALSADDVKELYSLGH